MDTIIERVRSRSDIEHRMMSQALAHKTSEQILTVFMNFTGGSEPEPEMIPLGSILAHKAPNEIMEIINEIKTQPDDVIKAQYAHYFPDMDSDGNGNLDINTWQVVTSDFPRKYVLSKDKIKLIWRSFTDLPVIADLPTVSKHYGADVLEQYYSELGLYRLVVTNQSQISYLVTNVDSADIRTRAHNVLPVLRQIVESVNSPTPEEVLMALNSTS